MRAARVFSVGALAVAVAVGIVAWRLHDRGPRRPSVGDAIDRFHTSTTMAGEAGAGRARRRLWCVQAFRLGLRDGDAHLQIFEAQR